jgi:hypothetical protein
MNRAGQPAYVLWLIREGRAKNILELEECLGLHHNTGSLKTALDDSLERLAAARLIEIGKWGEEIKVTPLLSKIQTALGLSITELAKHSSQTSMRVSPIFGKPSEEYSYDLFVLMPFQPELQPIYDDHIKTIAQKLKMTVARADDFFSTQSIVDEVWSAIVRSKVILADCTGRNPNVFYEIGIAHSVGKPVVLITQNAEDVPFDLRHRRYIPYEYTPRKIKDFENRLESTLLEVSKTMQSEEE